MTKPPEQNWNLSLKSYPGWLIALVCAGIIGSLIASASLNQDQAQKEELYPERSIYNVQPSGYRAWYLALQQAKNAPRVWKSSFDALRERSASISHGATMVLIQPLTQSASEVRFGSHQASQLLDWVKEGNTLVLIDDFQRAGGHAIAQELKLETEAPSPSSAKQHIEVGNTLASTIETTLHAHLEMPILSQGTSSFRKLPANSITWLQNAKTRAPLLIQVPYGKGTLLLSTLTDLAENGWIQDRRIDNYQLLFNLISTMPGPVWINEYVHGYVLKGDLISFYQQKTPLGDIGNQLLLLLILMLWVGFSRWKPAQESASTASDGIKIRPNASFAFMEALAVLYESNQASEVPIQLQLSSLDRLLLQHYGIAPNETDRVNDLIQNRFQDYSEEGFLPSQLQTVMQEAREASAKSRHLKAQDTLRLSQALTYIEKGLLRDCRHR